MVGVGGVVVLEGRALLIRRGHAPLRGRWSIPGGRVEPGETLRRALVREMREETGLKVRPIEVLAVVDRIGREAGRRPYHYVIVDYLCRRISGRPRAGSDALEVALVGAGELGRYRLDRQARRVVETALRRDRALRLAERPLRALASRASAHRARRGGSR